MDSGGPRGTSCNLYRRRLEGLCFSSPLTLVPLLVDDWQAELWVGALQQPQEDAGNRRQMGGVRSRPRVYRELILSRCPVASALDSDRRILYEQPTVFLKELASSASAATYWQIRKQS